MKYALHIAFSQSVGDTLLRIDEYAKKVGGEIAENISPLLLDVSENSMSVTRPVINCPLDNFALYALESFAGIFQKWNSNQKHLVGDQIEDFFEHEFSDHIIEENNVDAEMHLLFYVPLYESNIWQKVKTVLDNLPKEHKFIANVIGITYDMAWACKMLGGNANKKVCADATNKNIAGLVELSKFNEDYLATLLKHIFIFQNYNVNGWSQNFNKNKFIEVCGNLSLLLIEHYDVICHSSWQDYAWKYQSENQSIEETTARPIYAINLQTRILDKYLMIDNLFRDLFAINGKKEIINEEHIKKEKVIDSFKKIIAEEQRLIKQFRESLNVGLEKQSKYNEMFDAQIRKEVQSIVRDIIHQDDLNISEQHYLYTLFAQITEKTDFESDEFDETTWWSEEMMIDTLEGGETVKEAFSRLKRCSKQLTALKSLIKDQERIVEDLQDKIDQNYPPNGELTDEGFKIGNEIFKPYHFQETPLSDNYEAPKDQEIPISVDLRQDFSVIKNQGPQGACSAFSLVSVFEYFLHKIQKKNTDLSEAFVYYNARKIADQTMVDEGATFTNIIKSIRDYGVCLEELCPYDASIFNKQPDSEAYSEGEKRKITEAKNVKINVKDIKSAIAQGFPVVISAKAFGSYLTNANGVLKNPTSDELKNDLGSHAMVICGYSDREGFFIVRNSWGTDFGDQGYCYMPYEYVRTPNLINGAYVVTGVNIEGFKKGELPSIHSLARGKDYNAQYAIYKNMLHEKSKELEDMRKSLKALHKEYLDLFKQIADYSNVEVSMKDLKNQTDEQRAILEERLRQLAVSPKKKETRLWNIFGNNKPTDHSKEKRVIESQLATLDNFGEDQNRAFRIRMAILDGIKKINHEMHEESRKRQEISKYYERENRRIFEQKKAEEKSYNELKTFLPLKEIFTSFCNDEALMGKLSQFGKWLMPSGRYEKEAIDNFDKLFEDIIRQMESKMQFRISDYLSSDVYGSYYRQFYKSSVMVQIEGSVPVGYGDEEKYFFCNIPEIPRFIQKESEEMRLLPISDSLRMNFLHIEKYDAKDLIIFRPNNTIINE